MLRLIGAKYEYAQRTHRWVLHVVLPYLLEARVLQVEGDIVELAAVHAEACAIALREDDGWWPALEVFDDHAPLVLGRVNHPFPDCRVRHLVETRVGRDDRLHDGPTRKLGGRIGSRRKPRKRVGREGEKERLPARGKMIDGVDDRLAETTSRAPDDVVSEVPVCHSVVNLLDGRQREREHQGQQREPR